MNESVTTGNCPWCVIVCGPAFVVQCAKVPSGAPPIAEAEVEAVVGVVTVVAVELVEVEFAEEFVPVADVIPDVVGVM